MEVEMKNCVPLAALFAAVAFASCSAPDFSSDDSRVMAADPGATDDVKASVTAQGSSDDDDGYLDNGAIKSSVAIGALDVAIPDDYIRGFDASYVDCYENDLNRTYSDRNGAEIDFFQILAGHGVNCVRLRVWVDPSSSVAQSAGGSSWAAEGMNTTERAIRMAKRAKAAGLRVALDFHYSDFWTDPGKQLIPESWQSVGSTAAMAQKISDYTTDTLNAMKDEDCLPDFVQVGNEIDSGILMHTSYSGSKATSASADIAGTQGSDNFYAYLKAGCDAVRAVDSNIKIILHVTERAADDRFGKINAKTGTDKIDYDIAGLSFYPWESSHKMIQDMKNTVASLKAAGKDAMIVETSMYWNYGDYDANKTDLKCVYAHMVDPATSAVYSDLTTHEFDDGTVVVEGTLQNQVNVFRHIMRESIQSGASGIFAWGGDMWSEWKYAFFDENGKAMDSIDVFAVKGK